MLIDDKEFQFRSISLNFEQIWKDLADIELISFDIEIQYFEIFTMCNWLAYRYHPYVVPIDTF